jgi:arylsulfatase
VKDGKPFQLVHAFSKVHFINVPSAKYRGRSPAKDPYHDSVVEVDDIVGRLTSILEQLGVAENTLVLFTSDNGPEEDAWPDSGHTPFRCAKGTTLEGGVRVPGIAWWPGSIKAGRASDGLFDLMDLFNTSLSLAGVDAPKALPADRFYDGVDQTGFLLADDGQSAREAVYLYNETQLAAMRWRNWKLRLLVEQVDGGTARVRHVAAAAGARDHDAEVPAAVGLSAR